VPASCHGRAGTAAPPLSPSQSCPRRALRAGGDKQRVRARALAGGGRLLSPRTVLPRRSPLCRPSRPPRPRAWPPAAGAAAAPAGSRRDAAPTPCLRPHRPRLLLPRSAARFQRCVAQALQGLPQQRPCGRAARVARPCTASAPRKRAGGFADALSSVRRHAGVRHLCCALRRLAGAAGGSRRGGLEVRPLRCLRARRHASCVSCPN
jgi:hypothetical protein